MLPMPLYTYKAVREDGSSVKDEAIAADPTELRRELEGRGLLVLDVAKKSAGLGSGRGNAKDFLLFNQEFLTLFKAGLPILQSLEILYKRTEKPAFRSALESIIHDIKGGASLSDAMAQHPAFFSPLYTATVRAGEKSGSLIDILKRYIDYQKKMLAIRRKLVTALAYPAFLVLALVGVLLLFFFYIIPNFTQMFGDQGSLPVLTTMLISFTTGFTKYFPFIILAAIALGFGLYSWQRTDSGKKALDNVKLRVPVAKTLMNQYILSQLTRTLATVLRGGIPLVQAIDTTAGVIRNRVMAERLAGVREMVTEGVSLATAVERSHLAADMTVRMIEVGESSGDLPQMLEEIAEFYDQELENKLAVLTTMIEPVLMLSMGLIIAVIVVALYLPIFEMGSRLK
jgi:type IV pilus assembly protein PilC